MKPKIDPVLDRRRFVIGAGGLAATIGAACTQGATKPRDALGGSGGEAGGGSGGGAGGRGGVAGTGGSGGAGGSGGVGGQGGDKDASAPDRGADGTATETRPGDGGGPSGAIDTHVHFWDPAKPGGINYPPMTDTFLYKKFMPDDWEKVAKPRGFAGTVLIEAVWTDEMSRWALDLANSTPSIVAVIGRLSPSDPMFAAQLDAYMARSKLFRGIRTSPGNLGTTMSSFVLMGDKGLTVDINPAPTMSALSGVANLARAVPKLKVVIEHVGQAPQKGMPLPMEWIMGMNLCAREPNVFCKVSALVDLNGTVGSAPTTAEYYRPTLDHLWNAFGEDRLMFGSNWPVALRYASFGGIVDIVEQYFGTKGSRASEKFFTTSSKAAYGWPVR